MQTRRSILLVILLAIALPGCERGDGPPPDNAYVGLTREQVLDRLGAPDARCPGHYGLPPLDWAREHEPAGTFTYQRWNGTLYLTVYQKDGQWICCSSHWLGKGGAF